MFKKVLGFGILLRAAPGIVVGNRLQFTISSTTIIDPVFTAGTLVNGDFVWTKPDGVTTFTGKAPAGANFTAAGRYLLACTDWAAVTAFSCDNDNLTSLAFPTGMTALAFFYCGNNGLTALDVSGLTGLKTLVCEANSISSLTLPTTGSLLNVYAHNNLLTTPPGLTGNPGLYAVHMADNDLAGAMNLSGLTALYDILLNNNALTSINLSGSMGSAAHLIDCDFGDNSMASAAVDAILMAMDATGAVDGRVDTAGNAAPGPLGDAAVLNLLANGWIVETD